MKILIGAVLLLCFFSCSDKSQMIDQSNDTRIIPQPLHLIQKDGEFEINAQTKIIVQNDDADIERTVQVFREQAKRSMGFDLEVTKEGLNAKNICILPYDSSLKGEEYEIIASNDGVAIKGGAAAGVFYGFQTLRQLLPTDFEQQVVVSREKWIIPAVEIKDAPRFEYRGMHLDVGRHMYPVAFIKKYLDMLALHKMNRFHWHLTEDQGWRLEIKKYPKLQTVAAYRNESLIGHYRDQPHQYDGKKYGGYYTQEEAKEIVAYAAERFIEVIPEIEMPGHSQAAIAAYPELGCTGEPVEVAKLWGVMEEVYCPTETTFQFLEDVLTEVIEIFPSEYIHIGGDECPKVRWKESAFAQQLIKDNNLKDEHGLQSYFIKRMERFLNANGRQIIGWDEILEGGLAPNATVMSWRGIEGGIEAAKQKHDVIMTPTTHVYFDYYQSSNENEPLAIGGLLPLEKVYNFNPMPEELNEEEQKYVIGAQGNLWSEYIPTAKKAEYMVFPRLCAMAEVCWTADEYKDYSDFAERLDHHFGRLDGWDINYAKHLYDPILQKKILPNGNLEVSLFNQGPQNDIRYRFDGNEPTEVDPLYTGALELDKNAEFRAKAFLDDGSFSNLLKVDYRKHLATGKTIVLEEAPAGAYPGAQGALTLVDGIRGRKEYDADHWLGFEGKDCIAKIDLGKEISIDKVTIGTLKANGSWIYLPSKVEVEVSHDDVIYEKVATMDRDEVIKSGSDLVLELTENKHRFVRVNVSNFGIIPNGLPGAGQGAWLFIDEIIIE